MVTLEAIIDFLQNPFIVVSIIVGAFGIGITHGYILGKAILLRFPKLQNHAKKVAVGFFFLFSEMPSF